MIAKHTAIAILGLAGFVGATFAQTDTMFTYQGSLMDGGSPANGAYYLEVSLWDSPAGGSQLGSTNQFFAQTISEGLFSIQIDFGTDGADVDARWIEIEIDGTKLLPRTLLTAAPYAVHTRGLYVDDQGSVGIGTTAPTQLLDVRADSFTAIQGISTGNSNGIGVYGRASSNSGITYGLYGLADSPGGTGVSGWADSPSGTTYGVFGRADSPDGYAGYFNGRGYFGGNVGFNEFSPAYPVHAKNNGGIAIYGDGQTGVYGSSTSSTGRGVLGFAASTTGTTYGVYGLNASDAGSGVFGISTKSSGGAYGGRFECASTSGRGVYGEATASTGFTAGGRFECASTSGVGVYGVADASTGNTNGVYGSSRSTSGRGVYGIASNYSGTTYGVYGLSASSDGYGVYGINQAGTGTTYGVYGKADSDTGRGTYGYASHATGINYGVVGRSNSPNGFDFFASGTGTNYGAFSSRRWKNNVVNIDSPLDKLASLRGVYFDWDDEHGGQHDVGMIAEEVGKILPEIVNYEENGYDAIGMDYSKLTPLLVEAVNALRAENDSIKDENDTLRERLRIIEAHLNLPSTIESEMP